MHRDAVRRELIQCAVAKGSWDTFNELLEAAPIGNSGNIGLYYKDPEITPTVNVPGIRRFLADGSAVDSFTPEVEVRAVVEARFLAMRLHGQHIGMQEPKRVIATGGASSNAAIVQVASNVFGAPVLAADSPDAAALGAALRSIHASEGRKEAFADMLRRGDPHGNGPASFKAVATPDAAAHAMYTKLLSMFAAREAAVSTELAATPP